MKKIIYFIISMVILSCAAQTPFIKISPEEKTRIYDVDFDTIWTRLIYVLNERELPIIVIEKQSGLVVTDFVLFDCYSKFGKSVIEIYPMEIVIRGRYKTSILVIQQNFGKTSVRINVHIEKLRRPALIDQNFFWYPQPSNGVIEKDLFMSLSP